MSDTRRSMRLRTSAARPAAMTLAGAGLVATALWAAWTAPWMAPEAMVAREALSPRAWNGTDATLLLAAILPLAPLPALWAASWFGAAGLLGAGLLAGHARPVLAAAVALAACLNPLALHAYSAGWGLAACGAFALSAQLAVLPNRPPHRGFALLGVAAAFAAASMPGSAALALPFFAVLFLAAPRPWSPGTMRSLYVTAFALPAAWFAFLAYLGVGGASMAAPSVPGNARDVWHFALGLALVAACAPGLAASAFRRPEGAALLLLGALAFVAPGVPDTLALFLVWGGQAARALRDQGPWPVLSLAVGTLGSVGACVLLV